MRLVVVALAFVWALASLATSFFMVTSAFLAKTPAKEGILAQAALLLGGLGIAVMSALLIRQCLRTARAS